MSDILFKLDRWAMKKSAQKIIKNFPNEHSKGIQSQSARELLYDHFKYFTLNELKEVKSYIKWNKIINKDVKIYVLMVGILSILFTASSNIINIPSNLMNSLLSIENQMISYEHFTKSKLVNYVNTNGKMLYNNYMIEMNIIAKLILALLFILIVWAMADSRRSVKNAGYSLVLDVIDELIHIKN